MLRVWREVRDQAAMDGLVSHRAQDRHQLLHDSDVSIRKISDQLGHSRVSMTQDRYLGRKLTDRQTADVLDRSENPGPQKCPKSVP
jgi:integrase